LEVGEATQQVAADDVIIASEVSADSTLATELSGLGIEVHTVGDAGEVGYLTGAMHSAWAVATAL